MVMMPISGKNDTNHLNTMQTLNRSNIGRRLIRQGPTTARPSGVKNGTTAPEMYCRSFSKKAVHNKYQNSYI